VIFTTKICVANLAKPSLKLIRVPLVCQASSEQLVQNSCSF